LNFYYLALALVVLTFVFIRRLINSPTGAVFQAVRENEERAQFLGFNTLQYKLIAIVFASILATFAGMLQVLLNKKVGPELMAVSYTVDPLLMTIIGGVGTFAGPIIGSASLHLLDTFLRDAVITVAGVTINIADVWGLLLGGIFIAAVIVFPLGVVGTFNRVRARWQSRGRAGADSTQRHKDAKVQSNF
jgi:branched-chain amino acid transport system permease protein